MENAAMVHMQSLSLERPASQVAIIHWLSFTQSYLDIGLTSESYSSKCQPKHDASSKQKSEHGDYRDRSGFSIRIPAVGVKVPNR